MKHIVLIGMMGCGKTSCGQLLAQKLNRPFIDTDLQIETAQKTTISRIFAEQGEPFFRQLEVETAKKVADSVPSVVACGGGLPMTDMAMKPLKETGFVVWLNRNSVEIYRQVSMDNRPLGQDGQDEFVRKFQGREPTYRGYADLVIEKFQSVEQVVEEILEGLK